MTCKALYWADLRSCIQDLPAHTETLYRTAWLVPPPNNKVDVKVSRTLSSGLLDKGFSAGEVRTQQVVSPGKLCDSHCLLHEKQFRKTNFLS